MSELLDPHFEVLPAAQQQLWPLLAPAPSLGLVLYGGTAVALHLGHRSSVDFDFFAAEPLNKGRLAAAFEFLREAQILQEDANTLVVSTTMPAGSVKVSFFGGISLGRVNDPVSTEDGILLVASREDLLATKLKAILDRAEAKDYRDIVAMLSAGTLLERALAAFAKMYRTDPAIPLRALGFFQDGDLPSLSGADQKLLRAARDHVRTVPEINLHGGLLPAGGT